MKNYSSFKLLFRIVVIVGISVAIAAVIGFSIQAKSEISYLENRVSALEYITQPPKVDVLSEEMGLSLKPDEGYSISISKLIIEEVGLNTLVRAEITNKSDQSGRYTVTNRKATRTQEGYKDIDINSAYVVVPLTTLLKVEPWSKQQLVVMVSKLCPQSYEDTEAWISVSEDTGSQIKSELILRILIKGN